MKKFLMASACVGGALILMFYAVTRYGFYISLKEKDISADFITQEKEFYKVTGDGEKQSIKIKGVDVTASKPEHTAHEFAASKKDYMRWMKLISEMGANTIRVYQVMDSDFYDALYEFNETAKEPLYFIQGINVYDKYNYGIGDAYQEDFYGSLVSDGRTVVDIIHGKRMIVNNTRGGNGNYRHDVSKYALGILVGSEWSSDKIAYTDMQKAYEGGYQGTYFETGKDASCFETMLAKVMDQIVIYESKKYGLQRPVGFVTDPQNDPFEYADSYNADFDKYEKPVPEIVTYARQLNKFNLLDAENIHTTDENLGGYFVGYHLYDFCHDFSLYLSKEEKERLKDILPKINKERSYDGYLDLLGMYHSMPVIAAGFGMSSARGIVSETSFGPLTEKEQGLALKRIYEDMMAAGFAGGFISAFQDEWDKKTWNTSYAQDFENNDLWKDVQSEGQGYGLMEFDSNTCEVDGSDEEWSKADFVFSKDGSKVYARMDGEGLALLIKNIDVDGTYVLPIDVTAESGSDTYETMDVTFDKNADFVLCLSGKEDSRLLVQTRYEAIRENYLKEYKGEDPFLEIPVKNDKQFLPVHMVIKNMTMVKQLTKENMYLKYLPLWETGKLRYGNNNPESDDYDSLADFCFGENLIEVRIPWALLNFANPSYRLVHKDYYTNYGVEFKEVKTIGIGLGTEKEKDIALVDFQLKWRKLKYTERLKDSYRVIQKMWR